MEIKHCEASEVSLHINEIESLALLGAVMIIQILFLKIRSDAGELLPPARQLTWTTEGATSVSFKGLEESPPRLQMGWSSDPLGCRRERCTRIDDGNYELSRREPLQGGGQYDGKCQVKGRSRFEP